jgi:hypothetical protein
MMSMISEDRPAAWLEALWPAVCARVQRPVAGVLLDRAGTGRVAAGVMGAFLDAHAEPPASVEAAHEWLAGRAASAALAWVAGERRRAGDPGLYRDAEALAWERNPDFDALRVRGPDGVLTSRDWVVAEPVLRRRAVPVLARLGVKDEDAEDVIMEALGELTQARVDGGGPLEKMQVFEELPRFFAIMAERRAISWLRKQSARKRQASHPARAEPMDAPDSAARRTLADPRSGSAVDAPAPWESASFDAIHRACGPALTDFQWHLLSALFVEGTHTRLDLANDPWVLEQAGLDPAASESKRRRRLNLYIEDALGRLGRALEDADL